MKKLFSTTIIALSIFTVGVLLSSTGCRKKKDTIAKIYVYDASNVPVVGAQVVLFGEPSYAGAPPVVLFDTTTTNGSGEAIFNFNDVYQLGQAGVAVLNIDARKDAMTGEGIIKVEQETTSEESVFIAP